MKDDELDLILNSKDDNILPSSGFVASVMETVRSEAATPPIPFPWKRVLPGLTAACVVLVWFVVVAVKAPPSAAMALPSKVIPILEAAAWSVGALFLSLAAFRLSLRFHFG